MFFEEANRTIIGKNLRNYSNSQTTCKQLQHQNEHQTVQIYIHTACMAPPWFTKANSCCFGFLTGTRAPLFSPTNFRLDAIFDKINFAVDEKSRARLNERGLRHIQTREMCPHIFNLSNFCKAQKARLLMFIFQDFYFLFFLRQLLTFSYSDDTWPKLLERWKRTVHVDDCYTTYQRIVWRSR